MTGRNDRRIWNNRDTYKIHLIEKMMVSQEQMIGTVRHLCIGDGRIIAAVIYGSFTRGEGDEFSDIEFYLFIEDSIYNSFDLERWIQQIAPVEECFLNEFGTTVVLFSNLVRGEFHACPALAMSQVRNWAENVWVNEPDTMIILDRTGELKGHLSFLVGKGPDRSQPEKVRLLFQRFIDWIIFGTNVLGRGEYARGLELLWFVHRYLLRMVRITEGATEHYPTPSRCLEKDISPEAYRRYVSCTATLNKKSLWTAYETAWTWGKELMILLSKAHGIQEPQAIREKLDRRLAEIWKDTA